MISYEQKSVRAVAVLLHNILAMALDMVELVFLGRHEGMHLFQYQSTTKQIFDFRKLLPRAVLIFMMIEFQFV